MLSKRAFEEVDTLTLDLGGRRIACVLLPHFHWQVAASVHPQFRDPSSSTIVVGPRPSKNGSRLVIDTSPSLQGVLPGMTAEQAASRSPDAVIVEANMPLSQSLSEQLADAVQEITPNVEVTEIGRLYLDLQGLERLHGEDTGLVRLISGCVRSASGFDLRIGLGPSKWLAYIAARMSKHGCALRVSGDPRSFLSKLPLSVLPLHPELIARMQSFGLETLGSLAAMPRGACEAQFKAQGARAWELANGEDDSPFVPRYRLETVKESLDFPDPTVNLFAIVAGLDSLLRRAYSRPALRNRRARRCDIESTVFQATPWLLTVAFKEPAGSVDEALFAIKGKLDAVAIPGPLVDMTLTLYGLTGDGGRQESMWQDVRRANDLSQALAQLEERIGCPPPVYRVETIKPNSKVPEWRAALVQLSR